MNFQIHEPVTQEEAEQNQRFSDQERFLEQQKIKELGFLIKARGIEVAYPKLQAQEIIEQC